jgi:hypothetical protein
MVEGQSFQEQMYKLEQEYMEVKKESSRIGSTLKDRLKATPNSSLRDFDPIREEERLLQEITDLETQLIDELELEELDLAIDKLECSKKSLNN